MISDLNIAYKIHVRTFDAGCRGVLESVRWHLNSSWPPGRIWDRSNLWGTLAQIGPRVGVGITEAIGNGTVSAIDYTRRACKA